MVHRLGSLLSEQLGNFRHKPKNILLLAINLLQHHEQKREAYFNSDIAPRSTLHYLAFCPSPCYGGSGFCYALHPQDAGLYVGSAGFLVCHLIYKHVEDH